MTTSTTLPASSTPLVSTAAAASAAASGGTPGNALSTLSGNLNNFLQLLMTQLKNQDPTSPMDTNQFTSQLVQFSSVEQQINTNASLTKLIQLTQGGEVLQSSALVGKTVQVSSDHLALQGGTAGVQFTAAAPGAVSIAVTTNSGITLREATVAGAAGANGWTWDGLDNQGRRVADGSYKVSVTSASGGTAQALPFTVTGTATGVQRSGDAMDLQMGALSVDLSKVQSVQGGS